MDHYNRKFNKEQIIIQSYAVPLSNEIANCTYSINDFQHISEQMYDEVIECLPTSTGNVFVDTLENREKQQQCSRFLETYYQKIHKKYKSISVCVNRIVLKIHDYSLLEYDAAIYDKLIVSNDKIRNAYENSKAYEYKVKQSEKNKKKALDIQRFYDEFSEHHNYCLAEFYLLPDRTFSSSVDYYYWLESRKLATQDFADKTIAMLNSAYISLFGKTIESL
ncbi:hypothetical protein [Cysteiniphilum sp. 6C5]|uniref:hypothetical protein n=1 Tax=unclassified Cysteiniphilum TaxID=2610889 RepID=UPI003F87598F